MLFYKKIFLLLQSYNVSKVYYLIIFYNHNDNINEYAFFIKISSNYYPVTL